MVRRHRSLLWLTATLVALLSLSGGVFAADIAPDLAAKLDALVGAGAGDDFVRVIVRMEEQPFVSAAMGREAVEFILKETAARTQEPVLDFFAQGQLKGDVRAYNSFWLANVAFAEMRVEAVYELARLPGIDYIYEDYRFTIPDRSEERARANQQPVPTWDSYAATFAPEVWELGYRGQGITVAIADTGVQIEHPELAGAMGGTPPFHEGYWAMPDEDGNLIPGTLPHDTDYHGTNVAGTALGRSVGEYTVGMAPEATLAAVAVIPAGSGTFPQVLAGLQWVAEQGFDVVNGSFGANEVIDLSMAEATDNLANMGVVPVFSNGNIDPLTGTVPPGAPGNTPSAISIGAFDRFGDEATFNRGDYVEYPGYDYDEYTRIKPDISAPGVAIYSSDPELGYYEMDGTSSSAPHVAGAAALVLSANPHLTVDQVRQTLYETTGGHEETYGWEDIETKTLEFGWGRLNALRAVEAVAPVGVDVPVQGVVTAAGEPLDGATVTFSGLFDLVFETDEVGEFTGAVPEGHYTITAWAAGYLPESVDELVSLTDETFVLEFDLAPAPLGGVVGTVEDAFGAAIAGVTVRAGDEEASTDEAGAYELELPEGAYTLSFSMEGFYPVERDVDIVPDQAVQVDVTLPFGFETVRGFVRDETEEPLADVSIAAGDVFAVTDEDGGYALSLPAGDHMLEFAKLGYVTEGHPVTVEHGAVVLQDVTLLLNAGSLRGTVTNLDGNPISGAVVAIPDLGLDVETGAEGDYEFEFVSAGTWRVSVHHEDYYGHEATVTVKRDVAAEQHFVLQPLGGQVAFMNSFDTEAEQAVWTYANYSFSLHEWHFTDRDSVSEPYSAWHGDPSLGTMPADQAVGIVSPPFTIPEDASDIDLTFMMKGQIWGPYHGFGVFVRNVDTGVETLEFVYDLGTATPWTRIEVPLSHLAGQTVTVEFYVESDFLTRSDDVGIFIDDVMVGYVDPMLDSSIEGFVRDEEGAPIAGATVGVKELSAASDMVLTAQTTTDGQGYYKLNVPAGGWTVQAFRAPDFIAAAVEVYAKPGDTASADLELEENTPPAPVAGLTALPGDRVVHLSWDANEEPDLAGYHIERSLDNVHFHRIGASEEPSFTVDGLQNGRDYFFRVFAVDEYGLKGEAAEIAATPVDAAPTVELFDVQPRTLLRGGSLLIRAQLGHPQRDDEVLDVRLQATRGGVSVVEWEFAGQEQGEFEAVVDAVDAFGLPWSANIYGLTLFATDADGVTGTSNTVNVLVLPRLPEALSFLLSNNPFDPTQESQQIEFTLPADGHVTVAVYTLDGRPVATLSDGFRSAGQYVAFWDGADDGGRTVLAGMYVVRVQFTDEDGRAVELTRHSVVVK